MRGTEAARFLLEDPRHSCGNVVLTREVIQRRGVFREEFRYCPDEEAFLRYAAHGPIALDPRPLYLQRRHEQQVRFSTWRQQDFVDVYVHSRLSGAENFGTEVLRSAYHSTLRRLTSVAMTLALAGNRAEARRMLDELAENLPGARGSLRLWIARLAVTRAFWPLVIARRRLLEAHRRRRSSGAIL